MVVKRVDYKRLNSDNMLPKRLIADNPKFNCETRKLDEVSDINPSYRRFLSKSLGDETVKFVELSSVDKETGKIVKFNRIQRANISKRARFYANKGDILVPHIKNFGFLSAVVEEDNLVISDNFAVIIPKCDIYYLLYCLEHSEVMKQIEKSYRGSGIQRISLVDLKKVIIPWYDENTRKKLSSNMEKKIKSLGNNAEGIKVSTINNVFLKYFHLKIEKNKEKILKVEYKKLANGSWETKQLLRNGEDIYKDINYEVSALEEICINRNTGLNPSKLNFNEQSDLNIFPIIRGNNLEVFNIKGPFKEEKINEEELLKKSDYRVKAFDVLVRVKGSVGSAALVTKEQEGLYFHDHILRITVNEEKVLPQYLVLYLNSRVGIYEMEKYLKGSTTRYITVSDFMKLRIIVPETYIQQKIIGEIMEGK